METARRRTLTGLFALTLALAPAPGCFSDLLSLLDRRLHVVPSLLQLSKQAFSGKFTLEVFDRPLNSLAVDDDLKWLALDGLGRVLVGLVVQGTGNLSKVAGICKSNPVSGRSAA